MRVALLVPAGVAIALTACVTDANRCTPGLTYDEALGLCFAPPDAGGDDDAGPAPTIDAAPSEAGDAGEGGTQDAATMLGASCNGDADCSGRASLCLKSPLAPTDPGICTIPHCASSDCTSGYVCCDCAAAAIASLISLPPVCAPTSYQGQLVGVGCKCQ